MSYSYDSSGGSRPVFAKTGAVTFKFGTGTALSAKVQEINLNTSFSSKDVTPIGMDGVQEIVTGHSTDGSAKFNFFKDSEALARFINLYADIVDTEDAGTPTTEEADFDVAIVLSWTLDTGYLYEADIIITSASTKGMAKDIVSYDVNFKVNGNLRLKRTYTTT